MSDDGDRIAGAYRIARNDGLPLRRARFRARMILARYTRLADTSAAAARLTAQRAFLLGFRYVQFWSWDDGEGRTEVWARVDTAGDVFGRTVIDVLVYATIAWLWRR